MGCAWEPQAPIDMSLFTGVEVINGGGIIFPAPTSGIANWPQESNSRASEAAITTTLRHRRARPAPSAGQRRSLKQTNFL